MAAKRGGVVLWIERALLAFGVVCLGYVSYVKLEARHFQREQAAALDRLLSERGTPAAGAAAIAPPAPVAPVAPLAPVAPARVGIVEIPRLKVSSAVISGDGPETLDVAVGHLPDTPKPWDGGNSAFAAHRDGVFRPLKNIRVGDDVRVRSTHGDFLYRVRETKIVTPDDLSVLRPTAVDTLTLITCYPFNYIGHAPKRFVVHAERVSTDTP